MTSKGMSRDNASDQNSRYILIPKGDRLPEIIDSSRALRLVQATAESNDYDALQRVFDRIEDADLAATVRAMTPEGLLIHGTMSDAFALSHATEMKTAQMDAAAEAGASNIMFLSDIREKFAGSVAHYTGHVRKQIKNISDAFDGTAAANAAPAARTALQPRMAMAV